MILGSATLTIVASSRTAKVPRHSTISDSQGRPGFSMIASSRWPGQQGESFDETHSGMA